MLSALLSHAECLPALVIGACALWALAVGSYRENRKRDAVGATLCRLNHHVHMARHHQRWGAYRQWQRASR